MAQLDSSKSALPSSRSRHFRPGCDAASKGDGRLPLNDVRQIQALIVSDYFAELYVAGRVADAGWNVYFPHRDKGFDFIISKPHPEVGQLIRPVQVKGKYPTDTKGDKTVYGYIGRLTQTHPEMVLAIPFFPKQRKATPNCVAYMPLSLVRTHQRGFRCQPASFRQGSAAARRDYLKFFDDSGLKLLEDLHWKNSLVTS